jgi:hypothetical protein
MIIEDFLLVRCKKADNQGLGHNVETQQNMSFLHSTDDLFGFAGYRKVEIVYVLNDFGTAIRNILVQARDGDRKIWCFPLERPAAEQQPAPVVPIPPTPPVSPTLDASDLVHPRVRPVRKEETDDSEK